MKQYLKLLKKIQTKGVARDDRTGIGTISLFDQTLRFDLQAGFPAITTKSLAWNSVVHELLWFLNGDSNIKYLVDNNVRIWNEWPYKAYLKSQGEAVPPSSSTEWKEGLAEFVERIKNDDAFAAKYGNLGPVYGHQWRHWPDGEGGEIDQIQQAVDTLTDPETQNSRRIIVNAWNVADISEMTIAGLPPCHLLFQFLVIDGKLNCHLTQRSADVFLGIPFNIASYALLTMMMAQVTGLQPGELAMTLVDAHLYKNHEKQVKKQLKRKPYPLPQLELNPEVTNIFDFTFGDIKLVGYQHHPSIPAPVAV